MLVKYFFISNIVLMVVCTLFALVFLTLPLPKDKGLNNYKATLRVLSICYIAVSVFIFFELSSEVSSTDYISSVFLAISLSQAILFTISLNNLFNPKKISFKYLVKQCIPLIIFVSLHFLVVPIWGYPILNSLDVWIKNIFHPTVLLREIFLLVYVGQLIYYSKLFFGEETLYNKQLDDYCADTASFQLPWVRYGFFTAIFVGILSIITTVVSGELLNLLFNILLVGFYSFFALRFIQYPWIFQHIGAIFENIDTAKEQTPESQSVKQKQSNWLELKKRIISEKMYLKQGVTVDEIARLLNISRTELSGLINNEELVSFNVLINRLRIADAQSILLQFPDYPVTQIAEMLGYSEQSNFSRQFKLHTNFTPTLWREEKLVAN